MGLTRLRLPQSIRNRVVVVAALVFASLALTQYVVQHAFLLPHFSRIERAQAYATIDRVSYALAREQETLAISARDWGNWVETYRYVHDHNPGFLDTNVNAPALRDIHAHLVSVIDPAGRIVSTSAFAPRADDAIKSDFLAGGELGPNDPLRGMLGKSTLLTGLVTTAEGPMLVATAPILDGSGKGRPAGMLVLGRFLLSSELAQAANLRPSALHALPARYKVDGAFSRPAADEAVAPDDRVLETDATTLLYRPLHDLEGRPVATLRLAVAREISESALHTIFVSSCIVVVLAAVALLALLGFLDSRVLRPLHDMTEHAVQIGASDDLSLRLNRAGSDELATLSRAFDQMVARLEQARSELIEKSFSAGVAEMASGALHNLGNALTPLAVRVGALGETLGRAPVKDMELALAGLGEQDVDPARRRDLEQFAILIGADLAHCVGAAGADAEAAQRQLQTIQRILTDQVRRSRAGAVLEAVRPADLVNQGADIVAPALRQRLAIELDRSISDLPSLRLPTTVLRQVFQNLIQNAAEAAVDVRGRRVRLCVNGAIVETRGHPELAVRIEDDGPGIAPDVRDRLFERHFSTKSKDTNSGIGLHWCANALRSLGGEIRVTSDGPGRGACFHIVVPVKDARTSEAARAA